jgi:hypothetical protein
MSASSHEKLSSLQEESNRQTYQMVEKLNSFLKAENINLEFDAVEVQKKLAKNLFRERHIAQAIRMAVYEKFNSDSERESFLNQIFSGKGVKSALSNIAALENEIRNNLLKTGGAAFVPEDPKAFLSFEEVRDLIIDAGGIPCYPVLLDDPNGNFTDFEENKEKFLQSLINKNVYSIELIPGRNDAKILKEFVTFFDDNNFVVTFGTEHNTPKLDPMKISCRNGVKLDDKLRQINFEGAAVIAAHQYLIAQGKEGYLSGSVAKTDQRKNFVALGKSVIEHFFNS